METKIEQQSTIKLSTSTQKLLRCPVCRNPLEVSGDTYRCVGAKCHSQFPVVHGIPVLIDERASIFSIEDFVKQRSTYREINSDPSRSKVKQILKRFLPDIGKNLKSQKNYEQFAQLLFSSSERPNVLVIGGSVLGDGLEVLLQYETIEFIESDISFGPRTSLICDAHSLPFASNSLDGVVIQAVLEHIVDPWRCCEEIHRVLKPEGLVYAETPFMQQVHGGRYDFTRFTHLGHRRLFRKFEEIESGAVCGPGMALAWSYRYFLLSFTQSKLARLLIELFVRFTAFYLKYFDYWLLNKPGTFDAASAYYFIGKKSDQVLSDRELIQLYKGAL